MTEASRVKVRSFAAVGDQETGCTLLVGPYGGANLGDDAIARSLIGHFRAWGWSVAATVFDGGLGRDLGADRLEEYPQLRRFRPGALGVVVGCGRVVIGGGQQLQEPRLANPFWGHLANAWHFSRRARRYAKPYLVVGVGVDSSFSPLGRWMLRDLIKAAAYVSVRDEPSARVLREFGGGTRVWVGADPVFALPWELRQANLAAKSTRPPTVLWVLSNDRFHDLGYLKSVRAAVDVLDGLGIRSRFAQTDLQTDYDGVLPGRPELCFNGVSRWVENPSGSIEAFVKAVDGADCVVSSRMHALILAAVRGIPFVGLSRAGKMTALMERMDHPSELSGSIRILDPGWLVGAVKRVMDDGGGLRGRLAAGVGTLREAAWLDLERIRALFARTGSQCVRL